MEAKEQQQQHQQGQEQNFHVLAVDDSVIERKMLEKLLTISSYHVTCVESGDKALEYLGLLNHAHINDHGDDDNSNTHPPLTPTDHQEGHETRVNLIMTDYSMPGMTGYDLLKRVKGSSWKNVPVVVMSSENVPSRIDMCLEEGAEEFLLKPVRLSDLKKLQPYILKTTTTGHCCGTDDLSSIISKDLPKGSSCSISPVSNSNHDYKEEIMFDNFSSISFDKDSTKPDDGHIVDRRPTMEELTATVNL